MTMEAIKEAITELPWAEKTRLAAWLLQQDTEEWDRQIQEDFSCRGRGMTLLEEAVRSTIPTQARAVHLKNTSWPRVPP